MKERRTDGWTDMYVMYISGGKDGQTDGMICTLMYLLGGTDRWTDGWMEEESGVSHWSKRWMEEGRKGWKESGVTHWSKRLFTGAAVTGRLLLFWETGL